MHPKLVTQALFQRYLLGTSSPQENALLGDSIRQLENEAPLVDWMWKQRESLDAVPIAAPPEQEQAATERLLQALHSRLGFQH